MKCKKVNELLIRYLEEDLDEFSRSSIEKHLQECPGCKDEVLFLKQILHTANFEEVPSPSEDYWTSYTARLWQKIENQKQAKKVWARAFPWEFWSKILRWSVSVVASVLLILLLRSSFKVEKPDQYIVVPASTVQAKSTKKTIGPAPVISKTKSRITSEFYSMIELADGIYEFYNPKIESAEVLDEIYDQAVEIEIVLKEDEEKDCLSLIDELSDEEKKELIRKIRADTLL